MLTGLLLAAAAGGSSVTAGQRPASGAAYPWLGIALVAGVSLLFIAVAWLATRWLAARERRTSNSPIKLFKDLVAAHHLNQRERHLLTCLCEQSRAGQFRVEHPALLLIEPAFWEAERLDPSLESARGELDALRKKLFAQR
jgi:hypothetical protein